MVVAQAVLRDFCAIYRTHHGFVWHALHRFGIGPPAIEDAAQDVFVVAYRRWSDLAGASTKAWLYGIARRVASNYRRSDRRRVQRERAVQHTVTRRGSRGDAHEVIQMFDRYVASLSPGDRELFILSELEGMTGREIAQAQGRPEQTIYTRLRKLRRELRDDLVDLDRVRRARPRATEQAWAALAPRLLTASAATATSWGATVLALVVGAATVGGVVVPRRQLLSDPPGSTQPPPTNPPGDLAAGVPPKPKPPPQGTDATAASLLQAQPDDGDAPRSPSAPNDAGPTDEPARSLAARGTSASDPPRPGPAEPRPDSSARHSSPPPPEPGNDLSEQNAMLLRASAQLRRDRAAEAFATTSEHARRFPDSPLADLRCVLRVEALCAMGRHALARTEADALLARTPASPVAKRIKKSCAGSQ